MRVILVRLIRMPPAWVECLMLYMLEVIGILKPYAGVHIALGIFWIVDGDAIFPDADMSIGCSDQRAMIGLRISGELKHIAHILRKPWIVWPVVSHRYPGGDIGGADVDIVGRVLHRLSIGEDAGEACITAAIDLPGCHDRGQLRTRRERDEDQQSSEYFFHPVHLLADHQPLLRLLISRGEFYDIQT